MATIVAQAGLALTVGHWAIIAVVVAGIIGIILVALRTAGIAVPAFVIQVLWIIAAVVVCVFAIKLILAMM